MRPRFNRLLPDQLSEISQSIQVIQNAIKRREASCEVNGTVTEVDSNAGIFITMNPAGKGYGGRSKLPDNLTALFRAVPSLALALTLALALPRNRYPTH